jgi:hypothetical protein
MRKIIYTTLLLLCANAVQSQTWSYVGSPMFSNGNTTGGVDLQFLNNGTPIAGYAQSNYDAPYIGGAAVKYYNGTNWVNLGTNPIVPQNPSEVKIAVDANNNIYTAAHMGTYIKIFKLNNDWEEIGEITGVYGGSYREFSFKIDGNGTPYVVFTYTSPNLTYPACKKYDGTNWVNVGSNNGIIASQTTDAADISFDENNVPYVAISRENNARRVDLYQYNSSNDSWSKLNTRELSLQDVYRVNLEVVSSNEMYIGSSGKYSFNSDHRPSIVKYNGTNFVWIDSTNMTNRNIDVEVSYDIHYHNGKLYHAYMTGTPGSTPLDLIMESYNESNNTWTEEVSGLNGTNEHFMGGDINIGFSNSIPLIGIYEQNVQYKASVLSSGAVTGSPNVGLSEIQPGEVITMFPNPFRNEFTLHIESEYSIKITNIAGQSVYEDSGNGWKTINTSHWQNGMYLIQVVLKNGSKWSKKITKL